MDKLVQTISRDVFKNKSESVADKIRESLTDATIECLAQGGMASFTIERIAYEANISMDHVSQHFSDRDELLVAVFERIWRPLLDFDKSKPAKEQIKSFIDLNFEFELPYPEHSIFKAWLAIWGEIPTNNALREFHHGKYISRIEYLSESVKSLADELLLEMNVDRVARNLIAMIDGAWIETCLDCEHYSPDNAKKDCHFMLNYYFKL